MSINSSIPQKKFFYNNFPLHHTYDTTGRFGNLIPVDITEVAPADFHKVSVELNMRLSPLSAPAMVRLNAHLHSFYVPFRIITPRNGQESTWEKFILSLNKPLTEVPTLPYFYTSGQIGAADVLPEYYGIGSLWDYLTLPVTKSGLAMNIPDTMDDRILALPHLACLSIYDYWYRRDQIDPQIIFPLSLERIDLADFENSDYVEPEKPVNSEEEFDINTFVGQLLSLKSRNYERDYFTSALPEPQYGDDISIGDSSDVYAAATGARLLLEDVYLPNTSIRTFGANTFTPAFVQDSDGNYLDVMSLTGPGQKNNPSSPVVALGFYNDILYPRPFASGNTNSPNRYDTWLLGGGANGQMDITGVSGLKAGFQVSVEQLRMAFQLQGVAEAINRGGTRYDEVMKSVYGVSIDDLRLQKPQYLGGIKVPLTIGAVLQTSESANTPQGTLTGQGGTISGGFLFKNKHMFKEHGYIVTFLSVTPRTSYTGGTRRLFRKFDPLDYYCQAFDHLGEQLTKKTELYDDFQGGVFGSRDEDFGYNPRYQEYKTSYSTSTGEFRTTLSNWVLTRSFNESPGLSPDFIRADSEDFDRLFMFENVENTSNEHFQVQIYFNWVAKRNMSKYSKPFTFY